MFCIKIHEKFGFKILAICDEEVLEKEYFFNNLKIKVSKNFYFDKLVNENELINLIKKERFDIINAFGKNSVDLLIKIGLINEKNILIIDNQKHAILQIL